MSDPDQLELLPGAAEGLRELCRAGYRLVVVSNQSPIGRGLFTEERLKEINARLAGMLARGRCSDSRLVLVSSCAVGGLFVPKAGPWPFLTRKRRNGRYTGGCVGRWRSAGRLIAGRQVGARTILVATGYGESEYTLPERPAIVDYFVPTLREAADVILRS